MAEKIFNIIIRVVFVFAFGAFLLASLHHIAYFFSTFEPDTSSWSGSYALAFSVDGTALMLTIGMMFFGKDKPLHIKLFVWFFIIALTGFSWVVNWEYATRFQSAELTHNPTLIWLNPVLASSFAFLNLAYSIVAELFGSQEKTVEQLQAEIKALDERSDLEKQLLARRGKSLIQRAKETVLEVKNAAKEVVYEVPSSEQKVNTDTDETANIQTASALVIPSVTDSRESIVESSEQRETNDLREHSPGAPFDAVQPLSVEDEQAENEQVCEPDSEPEVNTEPLETVNSKEVKGVRSQPQKVRSVANTSAKGERLEKVRAILKKNPAIRPIDLAKQLKISKSYASELKAKVTVTA